MLSPKEPSGDKEALPQLKSVVVQTLFWSFKSLLVQHTSLLPKQSGNGFVEVQALTLLPSTIVQTLFWSLLVQHTNVLPRQSENGFVEGQTKTFPRLQLSIELLQVQSAAAG